MLKAIELHMNLMRVMFTIMTLKIKKSTLSGLALLVNPNMRKSNFEIIITYLEGYESKYVDQIELLNSIEKLYNYRGWNAIER